MPQPRKLRFIANPHSGTNRKLNLHNLLSKNLDPDKFYWELYYTQYAGHAVELAREAINKGCYMVVACGGDGSVNEIASQLIGTETVLGVLPCGSGNGFAGHLGIGRDVVKAIQFLNEGLEITIDACTMNGRPFVNLSGIGFDAVVAKRLHGSKIRGFWGYLKSTLRETLNFKMQLLEIKIDDLSLKQECLLVEVANAPVYGYGFSIVPLAKFNDGLLEVLIAKKAPLWRYMLEMWRFVDRSFHKSSLVDTYQGRKIRIKIASPTAVHIDGEGFDLETEAVYEIQPASLKVLAPKEFVVRQQIKTPRKPKLALQYS